MSDIIEKSFTSPFIRTCIIGLVGRLQGMIKISIPKNLQEEEELYIVPISYSQVGSESYLRGLLMENTQYPNLDGKVDGTSGKTMPYGTVTMEDSIDINMSELGSGGVRVDHQILMYDEFGTSIEMGNSRVTFVPITLSFNLSFKCDTELTKYKIIDAIIENLIYPKKFKIAHKGIHNIGCTLKLSESISGISRQEFSYDSADGGVSTVSVGVELLTYKPVISGASTYRVDNTNKNSVINYSAGEKT